MLKEYFFNLNVGLPIIIDVTIKLLLAMICGGIIGFQRQQSESAAGFRTHILVCIGAAVYMMVSFLVSQPDHDPGRIAAQVASGIGFLGAGTIIKQGSFVRGLTTAASLWAVAGIGIAIGLGGTASIVAIIATLFSYVALATLMPFEKKFASCRHYEFAIVVANKEDIMIAIAKQLKKINYTPDGMRITRNNNISEIIFEIKICRSEEISKIISEVSKIEGVQTVSCDGK